MKLLVFVPKPLNHETLRHAMRRECRKKTHALIIVSSLSPHGNHIGDLEGIG